MGERLSVHRRDRPGERLRRVEQRVRRERRRRRAGADRRGHGGGANQINGPGLSSSNAEALYRQALAAVADACLNAEVLAKASGRSLGAITTIVEAGAISPEPLYREATKAAADSATQSFPVSRRRPRPSASLSPSAEESDTGRRRSGRRRLGRRSPGDDLRMSEETIDRSPRVSTLELFFDLVFVFTITQLTGVLVAGAGVASLVQVVVMLAVIWWMYDGYAWLTNAIATDLRASDCSCSGDGRVPRDRHRHPDRIRRDGLAFGLGYLAVVLLHAGMYAKGTSVSEVAAILRIVPYNLTAALLVLVGGIAGGRVQDVAGSSPRSCSGSLVYEHEGFVIQARHFVERHGLVIIVASANRSSSSVSESGRVRSISSSCSSCCCRSRSARRSGGSTSATRRPSSRQWSMRRSRRAARPRRVRLLALRSAARGGGVAAGLKKAVGDPYDPHRRSASSPSVSPFVACTAGFAAALGSAFAASESSPRSSHWRRFPSAPSGRLRARSPRSPRSWSERSYSKLDDLPRAHRLTPSSAVAIVAGL